MGCLSNQVVSDRPHDQLAGLETKSFRACLQFDRGVGGWSRLPLVEGWGTAKALKTRPSVLEQASLLPNLANCFANEFDRFLNRYSEAFRIAAPANTYINLLCAVRGLSLAIAAA